MQNKFSGKTCFRLMQSNFFEITLRHGCSPVNLLHIFRTLFLKNTSGQLLLFTSSCLEVFCKKGVPRNFAKFTEKQLC